MSALQKLHHKVGAIDPLSGARRLRDCEIGVGDRWIYSAGFNTDPDLKNPVRIDCELHDLKRLLSGGARVAILSHQGRFQDGTAQSLCYVAKYLSEKLSQQIRYVDSPVGVAAVHAASELKPGEAALFGNTRFFSGDENNDSELSREFSRLGSKVAIGGFSKAHRAHASNIGLLNHLPGYATDSLALEFDRLAPWQAPDVDKGAVAVLGGYKHEKVTVAFASLIQKYKRIVPTGTVLTKCLIAMGMRIGASDPGEKSQECASVIRKCLDGKFANRIRLPQAVVISRDSDKSLTDKRRLRVGDHVLPL